MSARVIVIRRTESDVQNYGRPSGSRDPAPWLRVYVDWEIWNLTPLLVACTVACHVSSDLGDSEVEPDNVSFQLTPV